MEVRRKLRDTINLGNAFVVIVLVIAATMLFAYGAFLVAALVGYGYRAITRRQPFWLKGVGIAAASTLYVYLLLMLQNFMPERVFLSLGWLSLLGLALGFRVIHRDWRGRSRGHVGPPHGSRRLGFVTGLVLGGRFGFISDDEGPRYYFRTDGDAPPKDASVSYCLTRSQQQNRSRGSRRAVDVRLAAPTVGVSIAGTRGTRTDSTAYSGLTPHLSTDA